MLLVWETRGPQPLGVSKGLLPQMVSHLFIINLFALSRWFCLGVLFFLLVVSNYDISGSPNVHSPSLVASSHVICFMFRE